MTIIRKRVKCRSGGEKKIGFGSRNIGQNEKKKIHHRKVREFIRIISHLQTGMPLNRCKFHVFV